MTPKEEAEFTSLATRILEPYCSGASLQEYWDQVDSNSPFLTECAIPLDRLSSLGVVIDAEMNPLALCPNIETAVCLAELINYACKHRPFHHPEDPTIIREGL